MKKFSKRILALILALIMAMPVILAMPFTASAAVVNSSVNEHLVAQYFTDSNLTADKSGKGHNLEAVNSGFNWTSNDGVDCVKFPGGSSFYRTKADSLLSTVDMKHGMTITLRAKMNGSGWQRFFDLCSNNGVGGNGDASSYFFFSPNDSGAIKFKNQTYGNSETGKLSPGMDSSWHSYAIVVYDTFATVHKDGRYWARIDDSNRINSDWLNNVKAGYLLIGASAYGADPIFDGWMRDFRVYDTALNSTQLRIASTDANNNHAAVDVRYQASVDFHGLEGKTYGVQDDNYYYDMTSPGFGLKRNSSAQSFNNDDNMRYFRMWDKKDQLVYDDNMSITEGLFQLNSDFRFDTWFGARQDTSGPYLVAIRDRNGNLPIQLLKNGNLKVNNTEITGVDAVYSGSNEKYHIAYTFSFDWSEQMLHFSAWGEYTDNGGSYNMQKTKDVKVTDYGLTLDPGNLAGINFLDGSGNGHVRFGGVSFYIPANQDKSQGYVDNAKAYVKANIGNYSKNSAYNTFNAEAYYYDDTAVNGYENVVWTPAKGDSATYTNSGYHDSNYLMMKFMLPKKIVLAYDGSHTTAFPVVAEMYAAKNWVNSVQPRWIRCLHWEEADVPFRNDHYWRGYTEDNWTTYRDWPGDNYPNDDGSTKIGSKPNYDYDFKVDNGNTKKFFWNKADYVGSGNSKDRLELFTSKYKPMRMTVYRSDGGSQSGWGHNYWDANDNHNIYVIDYKPIYEKIDALKSTYSTVSSNGDDYYTEDSINQFYVAAYKFMTASPKDSKYDYNANTLKAAGECATTIKDARLEYDKINLIRRADFSALDTAYNNANTALSANPQVKTTSSLNSLRTVLNGLTYEPNDGTPYRPNLAYNDYQSAINAEATSINNAINALVANANFSALDSAYTNAKSAQSSLDTSSYTTSSVSAYNTFLDTAANFPYHGRNTADRLNTPASPDQSSINTEASSLTNAQSRLELKADFTNLDAAKQTIEDYITENSSKYTTSSKSALTAKINSTSEFPLENAADRADTGVSRNDDIAAEKAAYEAINVNSELDPLADLSKIDRAYEKANSLLLSLNEKAPQYSEDSINNLISALEAEGVSDYIGADRSDIGKAYSASKPCEDKSEDLADDILDAYDALTPIVNNSPDSEEAQSVLEVYEAAVEQINNLDPDMYDSTSSSISTQINAAIAAVAATDGEGEDIVVPYSDGTHSSNIKVVKSGLSADDVEDVTALIETILTALTNSVKKYEISTEGGVSQVSFKNGWGGTEGGKTVATYGTTIVCESDSDSTAWYLSFTPSKGAAMTNKFQGYGKMLTAKVYGTTTVKAVKETAEKDCRVRIVRNYYDELGNKDDKEPVQLVDYVTGGTSFTLPSAPAIAFYHFDGYYIGERKLGAAETITADTEIIAKYTFLEGASCAINIDGEAESRSVVYNERISLTGGDGTYGWVEQIGNTETYRPFFIGKNVSFLATESTNLKAVSESEFNAYKFQLPTVNLRQAGVVKNAGETKSIFNGQIVYDSAVFDIDDTTDGKGIKEYGILIGAARSGGYVPDASQLVVENTGSQEGYAVLRAKSTKLVGANQFTIAINNLPASYVYRGYVIYKDTDGKMKTKYTELM